MSYYGYPNAQAYGANYQAYAAAYAAGSTFDQYQAAAAYNAAAYRAMQQGGGAGNGGQAATNGKAGASISQPAQRYDYTQNGGGGGGGGYDAAAYASNMMGGGAATGGPAGQRNQNNKWQPGKRPGFGAGGNQFNKQRRPPGTGGPGVGGAPVQVFYCEICKISCAGPQTYKEHLEGQKHKKREAAGKLNEQQQSAAGGAAPGTTGAQGAAGDQNKTGAMMNRNRLGTRAHSVIRCELCDVSCTGRDAYLAHVRGMKHQKTLKLHQKLGKPIPPDATLEASGSKPAQASGASSFPQAAVISAPPLINMNRPVQQQSAAALSAITATAGATLAAAATVPAPAAASESMEVDSEETRNRLQSENADDTEDTANVEPIGREYIETKLEGKILSFFCKLCECTFNDPNAKDMHTKGRRHRLAYKKKVDPSLRVDMKGNLRTKTPMNNRMMTPTGGLRARMPATNGAIKPLMGGGDASAAPALMSQQINGTGPRLMQNSFNSYANNTVQMRHGESFDDRHIIAKHAAIYPTTDEINAIQEIVTSAEKALKLVSDQIAEEEAEEAKKTATKTDPMDKTEATNGEAKPAEAKKEDPEASALRALKGVMRVGLLAKTLLLKGDTDVQLIVLCASKPTKTLLERVYKILCQKIDVVSPQIKYSIILDKDAETILIVKTTINEVQPLITCKVLLTSPAVRTASEQAADAAAAAAAAVSAAAVSDTPAATAKSESTINSEDAEDLLDKQRCLDSLAALRHAKWFQARASNLANCVLIIRILRDLCRRNPTWAPLTQWGLELLVEKSLSSATQPLSPGEALRRVLECVSSGVLLPNGPGLYDHCEKEPVDVSDVLKNQQREELTASAQMALRLLAFKQIYKILGMECLTSNTHINKVAKKRQHTSSGNESQIEEKKEKKEGDTIVATEKTEATGSEPVAATS